MPDAIAVRAAERASSAGPAWRTPLQHWRLLGGLYAVGMLMSSFDIFGVINVGITIRLGQLVLLVPIAAGVRVALLKRARRPLGWWSLIAWTAFVLAFAPNTTFLARNIGYCIWLLYSVALIFATVQLFTTLEQVEWLMRWYLYSFLVVALFGIWQFVAPLIGVGAPLVMQWWIPDRLARVNGFSYEPSYFATYMLIGWVLSAALVQHESHVLPRRHLRIVLAACTVAMIVSSSRSAWLVTALWWAQYPLRLGLRLLRGRVSLQALGYSLALAIVLIAAVLVLLAVGPRNALFLLAGTGIEGSTTHSLAARSGAAFDTFRVFVDSPFVGYSLGGVAAAIGHLHGVTVTTFEDAKFFEGNTVFLEVLAASGVVGFLAFAAYLYALIVRPFRLAATVTARGPRSLIIAMTWALVFVLVMLQFNQNILRPYLWIHIAVLSALYAVVRADAEHRRLRESPQVDGDGGAGPA